jgi:thiamine biosynthesis lipoprotein
VSTLVEHRETFACFGGACTVIVAAGADHDADARAAAAVAGAKRRLLEWHDQFTRFDARSELSRLNTDERVTVPVAPIMRRVVEAAIDAAFATRGLVDPTLLDEISDAGYTGDLPADRAVPLRGALAAAPARRPAGPSTSARWRVVQADRRSGTVSRPPWVKLDAGGIAKGVFADELAAALSPHAAFVVDCCGDLRLGGADGIERAVQVASPFDDSVLHTFPLSGGGVATSGIGRRSWRDRDGRPAHHLLDPATGRPAFTGVVQATAVAPTATEAEMRSKAAVLSGPDGAAEWLVHGGVIVLDDGGSRIVNAR